MRRKKQLENFFNQNLETLEMSRNRVFIDLYGTGDFELKVLSSSLVSSNIPKEVSEQFIVMERKSRVLQANPNLSKYICILPLIDISKDSEQITTSELRNVLLSSGKNKSNFIIPHSSNNFLSSSLWESEINCLTPEIYYKHTQRKPVCFTSGHFKILKQLYSFEKMPYLSQTTGGKTKISFFELKNARKTLFEQLFKDEYATGHLNKKGKIERKKREVHPLFLDENGEFQEETNLQRYRVLREIGRESPIKVLNLLTQRKEIDFRYSTGSKEIFYEIPFCDSFMYSSDKEKKEYNNRKFDAFDYINSVSLVQKSLF